MLTGYLFIISAAVCWGLSATWARFLIMNGHADAALLSQTRVFFAWITLATGLAMFARHHFRVSARDLPLFAVLGVIGMAGANFFLYWAIGHMNAALADLIQFTAPVLVVLWMWLRRLESLDAPKIIALAMSIIGCALALGITDLEISAPISAVASASASAVCFASVLILGKKISTRHSMFTYLNYALLSASIFWFVTTSPRGIIEAVMQPGQLLLLIAFALGSILLPYSLFFAGLQRVPASRASIVSTFEPVVVALGSWYFLAESLNTMQIAGMVTVVGAIVLIEVTTPRRPVQPPVS